MVNQESTAPVVFLPENEFTVERIFPIRSLLPEIEPQNIATDEEQVEGDDAGAWKAEEKGKGKPTPSPPTEGGEPAVKSPESAKQEHKFQTPPYPEIPPQDRIRRLSKPESVYPPVTDDEGGGRRITNRSFLVPADPILSGPPGVMTGVWARANTGKKFYRCEDEPIRTPGAIQKYGVLLALRFNEFEDLEVRIASEKAQSLLGYELEEFLALPSFLEILDPASREDMVSRIRHALGHVDVDKTEDTRLDVFAVSIILPLQARRPLWCALHISNGTRDLIICEFEQYSESFRLEEQFAKALPSTPSHMIDMDIHPQDLLKSTSCASLPLRVLDISRRKKHDGVSSMDVFTAMTQVQEQLAGAANVQEVLDLLVGIISELTGMHRVMLYRYVLEFFRTHKHAQSNVRNRFDNAKNGCVDAELVNPKASKDVFLGRSDAFELMTVLIDLTGMHFPAADIPAQARALYKINRVRVLYDRDAETARLVMSTYPFYSRDEIANRTNRCAVTNRISWCLSI